jgi:hypothetical protein
MYATSLEVNSNVLHVLSNAFSATYSERVMQTLANYFDAIFIKCFRSQSTKKGGIDSCSSIIRFDKFRRTHRWNIDMIKTSKCSKAQYGARRTLSISITETSWLMMMREMLAVYLENHKKSQNKLCKRSWMSLNIQANCANKLCCHTKSKMMQNILLFSSCKDDKWNVITFCTFRVKMNRSQHFLHVEKNSGVRRYKRFLL